MWQLGDKGWIYMATETLSKAKTNKNDEFYTQLSDIACELINYRMHFKNKVVLCNCDDPEYSNFWIFFHLNFHEFKLKKLISTHFNKDGSPSYKMEYTGEKDEDVKCGHRSYLEGNGDFQSNECIELLKQADIVVTNPPFSLFREYVAQLMEYKKKFIIIGPQNAITYKEIFPLLKDSKLWLGYGFKSGNAYFAVSTGEGYAPGVYNPETGLVKFRNCCWYTNLDIPKRHYSLIDELKYQHSKHPEWYPRYDNYDAINIGYVGVDLKLQRQTNKIEYIPYDYYDVMGVPITFFDKYNPDEFQIIGLAPERAHGESVLQNKKYINAIQHNDPQKVKAGKKKETEPGSKVNDGPAILLNEKPPKYPYYTCPSEPNKFLEVLYARILIKRKE